MDTEQPIQRVEVRCFGTPPVRAIEQASGVSDVEIDGSIVRCLVIGSFQPFLEALRGCEVLAMQSAPVIGPASSPPVEGGLR